MYLTEDEAKQKWCPKARYVPGRKFSFGRVVAAINRWIDDDDTQLCPKPACCIASACMAWRWEGALSASITPKGEPKPAIGKGYCGAFGRPDYD